jgi:hypothetical protein
MDYSRLICDCAECIKSSRWEDPYAEGIRYCLEHDLDPNRLLSPDERFKIFNAMLQAWIAEHKPPVPIKAIEKPIERLSKYWQHVEDMNARPPVDVRTHWPMMSREEWAKRREQLWEWRPAPELLAHMHKNNTQETL